MKPTFPSLAALAVAAALAAPGLAPTPAAAQDDMGMTMGMALSMLELSAERELRRHGFTDVDVMSLTLSQIAGIRLAAGDASENSQDRTDRIRTVLEQN
jgi:hypothetical protein